MCLGIMAKSMCSAIKHITPLQLSCYVKLDKILNLSMFPYLLIIIANMYHVFAMCQAVLRLFHVGSHFNLHNDHVTEALLFQFYR